MTQLAQIEVFRLALPLVHEFETSSHRKKEIEHLLIRVVDTDGGVGWGEVACPADPYYCPETADTCWLVLQRYLVPAVLGVDWDHPEQVPARWSRVRGHNFAKAGLDMACWDLWARNNGLPLATALGGERTEISAGVSLGIEPTLDALLERIGEHTAAGYQRVKLKIGPGWDVEPVRAVRAAYPDLLLQVDANGAYTESAEHLKALVGLDDAGLLMVEQPFAPGALAAHARLAARLTTPLCLDESVDDLEQLDTALALGAGRILNIKVSRMGGLTVARRAHDLAVEHGLAVWCGGMHEFGVGRAANVALASLAGFTLPSDVSGSDKYFAQDVVNPPIRAEHGLVRVPLDRPGSGHQVDEERVRRSASHTLCSSR